MALTVLIHRPSQMLGDCVLSFPVINELRKKFPDSEFIGVFEKKFFDFALRTNIFQQLWTQEEFILKCPDVLDIAIVFTSPYAQKTLEFLKRKKVQHLSPPFLFESTKPDDVELSIQYYAHLTRLGLPHPTVHDLSELFPPIQKDPNLCLLLPGAGGSGKVFWPYFYKDLYDYGKSQRWNIKLILGPKEIDQQSAWKRRGCEYQISHSLGELIDLVQSASLYLGNDSGGAHLSAMLGNLTVSMHKKQTEKRWHIIGKQAYNLIGEEGDVLQGAKDFLSKKVG